MKILKYLDMNSVKRLLFLLLSSLVYSSGINMYNFPLDLLVNSRWQTQVYDGEVNDRCTGTRSMKSHRGKWIFYPIHGWSIPNLLLTNRVTDLVSITMHSQSIIIMIHGTYSKWNVCNEVRVNWIKSILL